MTYVAKRKKGCSSSDSDESDLETQILKHLKTKHSFSSKSDVYSRQNHIIFKGNVTKNNVYKLCEEINKLNNDFIDLKKSLDAVEIKAKPIYLHINSYGGYLDDAWAAVDFIKSSKIPIHTIVEGRCASAGTLMSIVGDKRYMTQHSRMLIHQLRGGMWGKMSEMEEDIEECRDAMDDIVKLYDEYTFMNEKQIKDQLKKEKYWNLETCIKKGLVDEEWKNNI